MLAHDLDALEEAADGYRGPLKIQVCGPWTLAATIELARTQNVGTILLGTDAIEPIVAGDEVAARVTNDRDSEFANFVQHVFAEAVGVRKL